MSLSHCSCVASSSDCGRGKLTSFEMWTWKIEPGEMVAPSATYNPRFSGTDGPTEDCPGTNGSSVPSTARMARRRLDARRGLCLSAPGSASSPGAIIGGLGGGAPLGCVPCGVVEKGRCFTATLELAARQTVIARTLSPPRTARTTVGVTAAHAAGSCTAGRVGATDGRRITLASHRPRGSAARRIRRQRRADS